MMTRNEIGAWGEELAATHVKHQGWAVLDRNWRTRGGELDIVAFDPRRNAIVAIEVKTRTSHRAGTPAESVTPAKVTRIKSLLLQWLVAHGSFAAQITVDVIAVDIVGQSHSLSHLKDVAS
ncbi:YraN family protein [Trueperella pyogenes]|uniref:YraN family protein n=1 Tax=Trueperella pyogenes TaxID=1661 RepID=UPI000E0D52FC|nr:YraN family protein [Trueperella pyogenes]